ncbi:MAG: DsbA family protein [Nanoarchaeota archaeon]|nr:DsbA family protein [Nanoarchaeota archaeon]
MLKLGDPKNAFWEALLLTVIVFVIGLLIGVAVENSRADKLNTSYENSEISLMDVLTLESISSMDGLSCDNLIGSNLAFADRIYEESRILDNYNSANKISSEIKTVYKKYDLLRTLLWSGALKVREQCPDRFSIVVYLYQREGSSIDEKAAQNVWSKILGELKERRGGDIVLIPISVDNDLSSLALMISQYNISSYPAVIVNDHVFTEPVTVEDLESYLDDDSLIHLN